MQNATLGEVTAALCCPGECMGHVGGPGRPASALRARLRGSFEERVKVLEDIADDPNADPQDRIRAVDVLAKYGVGTLREVSVDEVRERLRATITILQQELPIDVASPFDRIVRIDHRRPLARC